MRSPAYPIDRRPYCEYAKKGLSLEKLLPVSGQCPRLLCVVPSGEEVSGVGKKGRKMADDKILATLILDKEMIVTDMPCTGATLIAQYSDRYIVMAFTADRTCTLGLEGEQPITIGINELLDLMKAKRDEALH